MSCQSLEIRDRIVAVDQRGPGLIRAIPVVKNAPKIQKLLGRRRRLLEFVDRRAAEACSGGNGRKKEKGDSDVHRPTVSFGRLPVKTWPCSPCQVRDRARIATRLRTKSVRLAG